MHAVASRSAVPDGGGGWRPRCCTAALPRLPVYFALRSHPPTFKQAKQWIAVAAVAQGNQQTTRLAALAHTCLSLRLPPAAAACRGSPAGAGACFTPQLKRGSSLVCVLVVRRDDSGAAAIAAAAAAGPAAAAVGRGERASTKLALPRCATPCTAPFGCTAISTEEPGAPAMEPLKKAVAGRGRRTAGRLRDDWTTICRKKQTGIATHAMIQYLMHAVAAESRTPSTEMWQRQAEFGGAAQWRGRYSCPAAAQHPQPRTWTVGLNTSNRVSCSVDAVTSPSSL